MGMYILHVIKVISAFLRPGDQLDHRKKESNNGNGIVKLVLDDVRNVQQKHSDTWERNPHVGKHFLE